MKTLPLNIGILLLLLTFNTHAQEVKTVQAWGQITDGSRDYSQPIIVEEGEKFEVVMYGKTGNNNRDNQIYVMSRDAPTLGVDGKQWQITDENSLYSIKIPNEYYGKPDWVFYGPAKFRPSPTMLRLLIP